MEYKKNKNCILKLLILFIVIFIFCFLIKGNFNDVDSYEYRGNNYILLEYNTDIFTYNFISDDYYEVDEIYPISHKKWDMIYIEGDLFILDSQVDKATKYYADDKNYNWIFTIDVGDNVEEYSISLSDDEIEYLYNMDNIRREHSLLFDDIEKMGSIKKVSKDNTISALITLGYSNNIWYWRTEVIDVSKENDPEYVIALPKSLNNKIEGLINKKVK